MNQLTHATFVLSGNQSPLFELVYTMTNVAILTITFL